MQVHKMNKRKLFTLLLILVVSHPLLSQIGGFNKIKWYHEKLAPGLIWKSSHTFLEDSIPQNINILIVNLHKRRVSILYDPKENIPTSKQALAANAIASVNAGFFSIKDGGSMTYIKTRGKIADSDTADKWPKSINMTGALMIDAKGRLSISRAMPNSWFDSHPEFPDVLVTGPLLLKDKKRATLPQTSIVIAKNPRTSLGIINKNKVVLVTLDGRTPESYGMTLLKLTDLMLSLRCRDAVNLDGGGSTTMWIKGKPFDGVVNMPCDNKKFDHEGERAVSDILIIK
jgi:Exopolysaccharide biosynthesis protein related to N-acetylglucosamine-1-phosphodiester alpha-N-acetylglucosaminidase